MGLVGKHHLMGLVLKAKNHQKIIQKFWAMVLVAVNPH